jgi:hypothetical protein
MPRPRSTSSAGTSTSTHKFYLRKLAQKIDAGLIDYAYADHVEHDERLLRLANDASGPPDVRERAKAENYRRAMERIAHRLPDTASPPWSSGSR